MSPLDTRDSCFEIPLPKEFRFQHCLDYLSRSPNECLYEIEDRQIIRLLRIDGKKTLVRIGCPDDLHLQVTTMQGRSAGDKVKAEAAGFVRDWFDLERDLGQFYRMAEVDPLLSDLGKKFYGLRLVGIPDLFEALCWAIMGQQVNLAFAYKLKQRLTETFGDSLEWDGRTYRLFPLPDEIAGASLSDLCGLQLTKMKAAAILEAADLMQRGVLSRARLLSLGSFDAAQQELLRIRGVGPWTAHYVRMRCLRDPSAFPIGDAGLRNAVKERLALGRKPTVRELQALFADWTGWEAYATFLLWRSLY